MTTDRRPAEPTTHPHGIRALDDGTVEVPRGRFLDETRRTELRRDRIGFVFRAYDLLPALTVAENITHLLG